MRRPMGLTFAVVAAILLPLAARGGHLQGEEAPSPPEAGLEAAGTSLEGLLFVKHGRVGTRSEGPDYFIQTARGDVPLRLSERFLWEPDYRLAYHARRIVEVTGEPVEGAFAVAEIRDLCAWRIPAAAAGDTPTADAAAVTVDVGPRPRLHSVRVGGLVFVRHGRVGTRSEGPDYLLQTSHGDLELRLAERLPWERDPRLEMLVGRIVEVEGSLEGTVLHATSAREICATRIPD